MKKRMKRLLSLLLVGAMTFSTLQVGAWAQDNDASQTVKVLAGRNAYAQGGSEAERNQPVAQGSILRVKTDANGEAGTTTRKTALEFDLTNAPENCNSAILKLQIQRLGPKFDGISGNVYTIENEWDAENLTWNNFPARIERVATFSKSNIGGNQTVGDIATIDLSAAVEKALEAGETSICFELSFPTNTIGDGAFEFTSTRATGTVGNPAVAVAGPTLELSYDAEKEEQAAYFAALRARWKDYLLGGQYDLSDPVVQGFVERQNNTANGYWESMNKSSDSGRTYLWDDLPITNYTNGGRGTQEKISSGNMGESFNRLLDLATAYGMEGCDLYGKEEVKEEIIKGMDFMIEKYYNLDVLYYGNWFHWEITAPQALLSTCIILYDDLTREQLETYTQVVERFTDVCDQPSGYPGSPNPMTGANLLDKATAVALDGVLLDKAYKLQHVKDAQKSVYQYVTKGDGFYEDGSYIQHNTLAYTSGYGSVLYGKVGLFFYMFAGTPWEIAYEDGAEQMLYDTIFESVEPLLFDGQFMDMTAGRGIVRPTADCLSRGAGIIEAMLPIGESMTGEMKERFQSMVKYFIGLDEDYYYAHSSSLPCVMMAKAIMEDDSIEPRAPYSIHKTYAGMDRIVHSTPDYGFGISMSSSRSCKYENYSNEGYRIWNIADGMTYLYTDDRSQYTNGFWATVDPRRLPGTTSEYILRQNCASDREAGKTPYNWAGGADLGIYGVAGVQMQALGSTLAVDGAVSKKSWFMFDDEIVALGSGISSTTGNPVETIIDNRQIALDLSNQVTIDGETPDIVDNSGDIESEKFGTTFSEVRWANIEGNTEHSSIGYYFPQSGTEIHAMKERRDSNWNTQGPNDVPASGGYATLWFEHGENPVDEEYQYVILPNKNVEDTQSYSENPDIEVLANTTDVQAVRENKLGLTGVNFWNDEETTVSGITSNKKASVMVKTTEDTIELSVSDPTQANTGTIELTLALPCESVVSKDDTITVEQLEPGLKITVNVADTYGASQRIVLQRSQKAGLEVVSASAVADIKVPVGTAFADLPLPETVKVLANDLSEYEVGVTWNAGNYHADCYGVYTLEGSLNLPQGMGNSSNVTVPVNVQVGEISVNASQDTYVRDNNEAAGAHNRESTLVIKNDASGYSRKSIMKFPLSSLPDDFEHAYLEFELTGLPSETFSSFEIYQTTADWDETTLTWDNFPSNRTDTPISTVTLADVEKSLSFSVEITELVRQALEEGDAELSFAFSIPEYSKNNYTSIASLENQNCDPPRIRWEKTPTVVDKEALQALYDQNKNRNNDDGRYTAGSWSAFETALAEAKAVLEDDGATQGQIDTAAENLTNAINGLVNRRTLKIVLDMAKEHKENGDVDKLIPTAQEQFNTALELTQAIYDNPNATQDQVDNAWRLLMNVIQALGFVPGDKTELTNLVTEAQNLNLDEYQDGEAKDAFREALKEAQALLEDPDAMELDLDAAYQALDEAMTALKEFPKPSEGDKSELRKVIREAEGYQLDQYVDEGKDAFTAALEAAKAMESKEGASQAEIDAARFDLLTAMAGLRLRADKSSLNEWLENLKSIDLSQYTEESANVVRLAIARAEALAAQDLSEGDEALIQAIIAEMANAKAQLVPAAPVDPDEPENSVPDASGQEEETNTGSAVKDTTSQGKPAAEKAPATGDFAPVAALSIMAVAAAAALLLRRKRK